MKNAMKYLAAVKGAANGAAKVADGMAARIKKADDAGMIKASAPQASAALHDLLRVAKTVSEIAAEAVAAAPLFVGNPTAMQLMALKTAGDMRATAQGALSSAGRVEGAYQDGSGDVVADASLANVVRAAAALVYAATEAARQLEVIAGKIKL